MNDRQRIEHALIPALLESYLLAFHKRTGKFTEALSILDMEFRNNLNNNPKLFRRCNRLANSIIKYTAKNKFDARKAILMVTEWLRALIEAGFIRLEEGTSYWNLLEEIGEIIQAGYEEIENFERIDASAINHVPKIHKIAQEQGYYV